MKEKLKMNIRESFICIVLLFLAYSFHVHAIPIDRLHPEKCDKLSSLDFEVITAYVQEGLFEGDDGLTIEEEELKFQEDNTLIINITALNPVTGAKEQSQILDETGFFAAYLSGMQLMRKFHQGEFITERAFDTLEQYLDRFENSVDDPLCVQFIQRQMDFLKPSTGVLEDENVKRLFRDEDGEVMSIPHNGSRGMDVLASMQREASL